MHGLAGAIPWQSTMMLSIGLWADGSSGSCGARRATAVADLENDPHATPPSYCSAMAHPGPSTQQRNGFHHVEQKDQVSELMVAQARKPRWKPSQCTIHVKPSKAKTGRSQAKHQAGVPHPSSVQIHPFPIVESQTTHLNVMYSNSIDCDRQLQ